MQDDEANAERYLDAASRYGKREDGCVPEIVKDRSANCWAIIWRNMDWFQVGDAEHFATKAEAEIALI